MKKNVEGLSLGKYCMLDITVSKHNTETIYDLYARNSKFCIIMKALRKIELMDLQVH